MFFTYFNLRIVVGSCIGERYLQIGICHLTVGYNFEVLENLDITFVRIHDDIEILVGSKHFCQHVSE